MKKRLFIFLLILTLAPFLPIMVSADAPMEVYTEFTGGNFNHAGDGTKALPYNLFEDALDKVADGGTIYIQNEAFLNYKEDGQPLQINKNIKITRAPDSLYRPTLMIRMAGIVLGADVEISNLILSMPNPYHAVICANGYTLTLHNVSQESSARVIHLSGGGLYALDGRSLSPEPGNHSRIILDGQDTNFGNIYAGGINAPFDRPVDIQVDGVSGESLNNIYACGAREGYYNGENFLDPYNEPTDPAPDAVRYPVTGEVSLYIADSLVHNIQGKTGGVHNASLSVSISMYTYSCNVSDVERLTVMRGRFAPLSLNEDADIFVQSDAMLDLQAIPNCTVHDFQGEDGSVLIMSYDGCLTISGLCGGTTELRTDGGHNMSYIAVYHHLYIKTDGGGDGTFTFHPYLTQSDMRLEQTAEGWRTSEQTDSGYSVLTDFDIENKVIIVQKQQINSRTNPVSPMFKAIVSYEDENNDTDIIEWIPFDYTVRYHDEVYHHPSTDIGGGCYEGQITELNLYLQPVENTIMVCNAYWAYEQEGDIEAGVYEIDIIAPTKTGDVKRTIYLTVLDDGQETGGGEVVQIDLAALPESVSYGDSVGKISAQMMANDTPVTGGTAALYINGRFYDNAELADGVAEWSDIAAVSENGFLIGDNQITVEYSGSDTYSAAQANGTVRTDKAQVTLYHDGQNCSAAYDGTVKKIDFGTFVLKDKNGKPMELESIPEVRYIDEQGKAVDPVLPGKYTSYLSVPEGMFYQAVNEQTAAVLTIDKAEPVFILSGAAEQSQTGQISIEMCEPFNGCIPAGTVEIINKADGRVYGKMDLEHHNAQSVLTGLPEGEHTFYAVYTPAEYVPYYSAQSNDLVITVKKDDSEEKSEMFDVSISENGQLCVDFTNLTDGDITDAVMVAAVYDENDVMKDAVCAKENVTVQRGEKKTLLFDISNTEQTTIKVFLWNGFKTVEPVCPGYCSKK